MDARIRSNAGARPHYRWAMLGARLCLSVAATFFGLIAVTFFIGRVIPVDPVLAIVGDRAPASVVEAARREYGLDLPVYEQFFAYLEKALSGDFGRSVLTGNSVFADIAHVFPATIELATLGTIIGAGVGIPLGVLAAVKRDTLSDHVVRIFGLIGHSVPIFWLGLMALLVFYARLGWTDGPGRIGLAYEFTFRPVTGFFLLDTALQGDWGAFRNVVGHLVLPSCLLGYASMAYVSRMTRAFMLNELENEYIIAARAKGLSERRIIWGHALRNASAPLITVVALSYAGLLEGAVLTETIFAWPGIGSYITNSLQNADMNAVLGGTIVIGAVFIGINLLSDLCCGFMDPRMRP